MPRFQHFLAIDWSGALGARQKGIAIALCHNGQDVPQLIAPPHHRYWSRQDVYQWLRSHLPQDTLVGLDLGISLPFMDAGAFFPHASHSPIDAPSLWRMMDTLCAADDNLAVNSFVDHPEYSAYFRRHGGREGQYFHLPDAPDRKGRMRVTEHAQSHAGCKPYSNFNLIGAAQVGKSSLSGMRMLHHLRGHLPVWPIDPLPTKGSVIVEIYTTLAAVAAGRSAARSKMTDFATLDAALVRLNSQPTNAHGPIDDHSADAILTSAWLRKAAHQPELWQPSKLTPKLARTEGWTFGAL